MTDSEIQILIKAVDQATDTLKNIEGTLVTSNKNIQKQTEETSNAFDKQMGSMLVLGNAANAVDNIFTQYENIQLRLENASERVENAQARLSDAQYNLRKVQENTTSSADDLAHAQEGVDRATRALTISENNQQRTQNMLIGTYIAIGVETLNLIKSLPVLISSIEGLTAASMAFIATPIGIALVAIGAAVAIVYAGYVASKKATEEFAATQNALDSKSAEIAGAWKNLTDAAFGYSEAISQISEKMAGVIGGQSVDEAEMLVKIAELEKNVAQDKIAGNDKATKSDQAALDNLRQHYTAQYSSQRTLDEAVLNLQKVKEDSSKGLIKGTEDFWKLSSDAQVKYLQDNFAPQVETIRQGIFDNEVKRLQDLMSEWQALIDKQEEYYTRKSNINIDKNVVSGMSSIFGTLNPGTTNQNIKLPSNYNSVFPTKVGDAIIRPNGDIIQTDPNDTLIATKSGFGGKTIIIQIDKVYGMDPGQLSRALSNELNKKLSL